MAAIISSLLSIIFWLCITAGNSGVSSEHDQLSPKASLVEYWDLKIPTNQQKPSFILNKASPLTASELATFQTYAQNGTLESHLKSFCKSAHIFCFPEPSWSLGQVHHHHHHTSPAGHGEVGQHTSPLKFKPYGGCPQCSENDEHVTPLKFKPYRPPLPNENDEHVTSLRFKPYRPPKGEPYHPVNGENDEHLTPLKFKPYRPRNGENDEHQTPLKFKPYRPLNGENGEHVTPLKFKPYRPLNGENDEHVTPLKFKPYHPPNPESSNSKTVNGDHTNKWVPEPGKFFREKGLRSGSVIPMPDINDFMPERSFLPRSIAKKLPLSTSKLNELEKIFHVSEGSNMDKAMKGTLLECEAKPSEGEVKKCVTSIEDMIDFVVSMIGNHVEVKATNSARGSGQDVEIQNVKGINGGRITTAVTCHHSMFPFLVYYCHKIPDVKVYEATILDAKSKEKINLGMVLCHFDTNVWKESHEAFKVAMGAEPGQVELCHWVPQNDVVWVPAG